jgi:hypothetical protein
VLRFREVDREREQRQVNSNLASEISQSGALADAAIERAKASGA